MSTASFLMTFLLQDKFCIGSDVEIRD